ncbi:hypothetical protein G6F59_015940 [Rhizopus arrhizus]|nr:hypothetical protein G6F59_015940 [Rhizopus arrhizus]
MWPLIVLTDQQHYTLPVALATLSREHIMDVEMMMAGAVVTVVPVCCWGASKDEASDRRWTGPVVDLPGDRRAAGAAGTESAGRFRRYRRLETGAVRPGQWFVAPGQWCRWWPRAVPGLRFPQGFRLRRHPSRAQHRVPGQLSLRLPAAR